MGSASNESQKITEEAPLAAATDEKTKEIYVKNIVNPKYLVNDIPALAKVLSFFFFCDPWIIYLQ